MTKNYSQSEIRLHHLNTKAFFANRFLIDYNIHTEKVYKIWLKGMFHQHEIITKNRTFHEMKKKLKLFENFAKIQTFGHCVYNLARLQKILPRTKENMAAILNGKTQYNFTKIHLSSEKSLLFCLFTTFLIF